MPAKTKTRKLRVGSKTFIYRKERGDFWLYSPKSIEFYKFNRQGFAILLGIGKNGFESKIIKKLSKSIQAQNFLHYLVEHELVAKRRLRELNLL